MTMFGILLFAAPGYLLGQLLLGSGSAGLERVAVAAGLVFCVPVLGGLVLYAAGVPLHRAAWLALLAGVTLICDVALFLRRRIGGPAAPDQKPAAWRLPSRHVVAFAGAAVIALGAVGVARAGVAMQHFPGYTQLWLDRPNHDAPTVTLGVDNDEGRSMRYELVLLHNKGIVAVWTLDLRNGRSWQHPTQFTGRYSVTAKLYRLPDLSSAYRYVFMNGNGN